MTQPNFKIIGQSVDEVFPFTTDIDTQLEQCQYMTRISYRYEDKEAKQAPIDFVQTLINGKHYEPLEFVTIYADLSDETFTSLADYLAKKAADPSNAHVRAIAHEDSIFVFTLREVVEWFHDKVEIVTPFDLKGSWFNELREVILDDDDLSRWFAKNPGRMEKYARVKWVVTTNRQIATEITRHRALSKNWESTRHCIYNQDRFGGMLQICNPTLYKQCAASALTPESSDIINDIKMQADSYMRISNSGDKVQAAYRLPSDTAVKVAFAGFMDAVDHVILMRTTNYCGAPHVDANELMTMVGKALQANKPYSKILKEPLKVSNEMCERILATIPNHTEADRLRVIAEFGTPVKGSKSDSEEHDSQKRSDSKEERENTSPDFEEFKRVAQTLMDEMMERDGVPPHIREDAKRLAHDISERIAKHEIDPKDIPTMVSLAARTLAIKEMLHRIASGKQD